MLLLLYIKNNKPLKIVKVPADKAVIEVAGDIMRDYNINLTELSSWNNGNYHKLESGGEFWALTLNARSRRHLMSIKMTVDVDLAFDFDLYQTGRRQKCLDAINQLTNKKYVDLSDALNAHDFARRDYNQQLKANFTELESIDQKDEFYKKIAPFVSNGKITYHTENNEIINYNFQDGNLTMTVYIQDSHTRL